MILQMTRMPWRPLTPSVPWLVSRVSHSSLSPHAIPAFVGASSSARGIKLPCAFRMDTVMLKPWPPMALALNLQSVKGGVTSAELCQSCAPAYLRTGQRVPPP